MKTHYVYELYNLLGTIEYVGETTVPKHRLRCHKCKSKSSGNGKFYGRTDISMNIVKEFNSKKEAYAYQCQLQKQYGLETDAETNSKSKKGIPKSVEHNKNNSLAQKSRIRKPHSEETKQKMKDSAIRRYSTTNT